jgi:hypothetical protein
MDYETAAALRDQILQENTPEDGAILLGQLFSEQPEVYAALHHREIAPGIHISNPGPDPARMTRRYITGVSATADRFVEGMQNPRRNPVEAAIRAKGKWANRDQEAVQRGAYEAGVRSQDYAEAVRIATEDGGAAFVAGATKREAKVSRVYSRLAPLLAGVSQAIQAMPQDTDAQRVQRLVKARELMKNVGMQLKGRSVGA